MQNYILFLPYKQQDMKKIGKLTLLRNGVEVVLLFDSVNDDSIGLGCVLPMLVGHDGGGRVCQVHAGGLSVHVSDGTNIIWAPRLVHSWSTHCTSPPLGVRLCACLGCCRHST